MKRYEKCQRDFCNGESETRTTHLPNRNHDFAQFLICLWYSLRFRFCEIRFSYFYNLHNMDLYFIKKSMMNPIYVKALGVIYMKTRISNQIENLYIQQGPSLSIVVTNILDQVKVVCHNDTIFRDNYSFSCVFRREIFVMIHTRFRHEATKMKNPRLKMSEATLTRCRYASISSPLLPQP